jgi:hypothetical protein
MCQAEPRRPADIIQVLLARGADRPIETAEGYDARTYARKLELGVSVRALEGSVEDNR